MEVIVMNRFCRASLCLLWVVSAFALAVGDSPAKVKEIKVSVGHTADLWLGINVKGKVNYSITTRDGTNKMRMWWVMEPLCTVKQLGTLAGSGSLDIPGKLHGAVSAKLRGKAASDTVIYIGENVAVDTSATFHW
jgi:hypothetical protein